MGGLRHERLTALDALFVAAERDRAPMHVGATLVLEGEPLRDEGGELDLERLRAHVEAVLDWLPRYRQRLAWVPVVRHPVWVDDPGFDLDRHLVVARVRPPGGRRELSELAAELYARRLDPTRPLWRMTVIDGLQQGRVAVIVMVHHALADGVAGVALLTATLRPMPMAAAERGRAWHPRPLPSRRELLGSEALARIGHAEQMWRVARQGASRPVRSHAVLRGLWRFVRSAARQGSPTPLNPERLTGRRSFGWTQLDLAEVRRIRRAAGVKLNDVVLAVAAGGLHRLLLRRNVSVEHLRFRVAIPVSLHEIVDDAPGNKVAIMVAPLPVGHMGAIERLQQIAHETRSIKASGEAQASAMAEELADWTMPSAIGHGVYPVMRRRPCNVIVTNVPGPPAALYLLGARVLEMHPLVPLIDSQGVGLAILSYDGRLFFGVHAERDVLPDPFELAADLEAAFHELQESY